MTEISELATIRKTSGHQPRSSAPTAIPFGDKAGRAGGADDAKAGDDQGGTGERHLAPDPAEVGKPDRAQTVSDRAKGKKQRALHDGVIEEMHDAARESGLVGKTDAERDVADLRDRGVGEHRLMLVWNTATTAAAIIDSMPRAIRAS
jgi:hypothetical protein